ncbi:hypothetical protein GCM10011519_30070 [Marmoricola endophyticus]|uniref:Thioesterase domain-containing protein n=1 Tax=Marmoricola endophyticus TaxID=2040280 RepID=A0A917BQV2_9ACTN|nr:PaaI family thioesterase [Marmoricola endophyticus]GGF54161.1 hypothetical protein GCM10011519_30070 [Marmoricola endophyticus]
MDDPVTAALEVPLAAALGCALIDPDSPATGAWLEVGDLAGNGLGGTHASALDVLAELAGFLAAVPALGEGEHAVTHAISTQLLGAGRPGQRVEARGRLVRRTGRLAFVDVTVTADDVVLATSQITKSVVRPR